MANNGELNEIQSRALKLLLEGVTATEVAKALGKGKRTIERWRASKPFKDALSRVNEQVEQKIISESSDRISKLKNLALDAVAECLSDSEQPMRYRLQGAKLAGVWAGLEKADELLPSFMWEKLLDIEDRVDPNSFDEIVAALVEIGAIPPRIDAGSVR